MKSFLQRIGVVLATMISLVAPLSIMADPIPTDEVTRYVREHEEVSQEDRARYLAIYAAVSTTFKEFIHNRTDGKNITAFIQEFKQIIQQFNEFANATHNHQLRSKLKSLHKDLNAFITLLQKNQGNHYLILAAKLKESGLAHLIPGNCRFSDGDAIDALAYRCSR